ncbi:MAG: lipoprotein [Pseudomonadota bacterium]
MSTTSASSHASTLASTLASTAFVRVTYSASDSGVSVRSADMVDRIQGMLQRKNSVAAASKAALGVCACVAAVALLAACGQKGPLQLPKPATAASSPPAVSPATSASAARP